MTKRKTLTVQLMEANTRIAYLESQLALNTVQPVVKTRTVNMAEAWRQACAQAKATAIATGKTTLVVH